MRRRKRARQTRRSALNTLPMTGFAVRWRGQRKAKCIGEQPVLPREEFATARVWRIGRLGGAVDYESRLFAFNRERVRLIARTMPLALLTVSSYSASGLLSATTPQPAWT